MQYHPFIIIDWMHHIVIHNLHYALYGIAEAKLYDTVWDTE